MKPEYAIHPTILDRFIIKRIFTTFSLLILTLSGISQEAKINNTWAAFQQSIDISAYRGKTFRFKAAVRIIGKEKEKSRTQLWARVDLEEGVAGRGFFYNMDDRPITASNWAIYSFDGIIHPKAKNLVFGGIVRFNGQFYFDEFQIELLGDDGKWKPLAIKNRGFEDGLNQGNLPVGWSGSVWRTNGYFVSLTAKAPYKGKYALLVEGKGIKDQAFIPTPSSSATPKIPLTQTTKFRFRTLSVEHGLSSSFVTCFLQDKRGMMWIGTDKGLNRYDGYRFKTFLNNSRDSQSLGDNMITALLEDRSGRIWVGTTLGLDCYDPKTETFRHYHSDSSNLNSLSHSFIHCIKESSTGSLWIGTRDGLNVFHPRTQTFTRYRQEAQKAKDLDQNFINDIFLDTDGKVWCGTNDGTWALDPETEKFERIPDERDPSGQKMYDWVHSIMKSRQGKLLFGGSSYITSLNPGSKEKIRRVMPYNEFPLSSNYIFSMLETADGTLWIGTRWGGLNRVDPARKVFQYVLADPENPYAIASNTVNALFLDREGILWIGTDKGISCFHPMYYPFEIYQNQPGNNTSLSENSVSAIVQDRKGRLWVGTTGRGLNRMDPDSNSFRQYWRSDDRIRSVGYPSVSSIFEDRQGMIWLSSAQGGAVGRLDPDKDEFVRFMLGAAYQQFVGSVFEDRDSVIWAGSAAGLSRLNPKTREVVFFPYAPENPNRTRSGIIQCIMEDSKGDLWVGVNWMYGLNRFDRNTGKFQRFVHSPQDSLSISSNEVFCMFEDRDKHIWIGTSKGLNRLDPLRKQFTRFGKKFGLPEDPVLSMQQDGANLIWMSTTNGLYRFDPKTGNVRHFDQSDGLPGAEFIVASSFRNANTGKIYFGGTSGLVSFHPDSLRENPFIPPLVITAMQRYNQKGKSVNPIEVSGIAAMPAITLSYRDKIITFEFAGLSYLKSEKNQYAYRLKGFQEEWVHLGNKHEATFTNLAPGKYTLQIKGSNGDGIWNEEGISLEITITPPWYWAWYTKTLYLLLLAGALYALYRWRTREQRLKIALQEKALAQEQLLNARLRQIDQLKDQFLANTSHELRTPLHGIIGIAESLFDSVKKRSAEEIQQNLGLIMTSGRRLASLVNDLLDFSRVKNRDLQLQPKSLNLRAATAVVLHACRPLLGSASVELINKVPEDLLPVQADENRLQQILFNLVGNAIKFTREGYIAVNARQTGAMTEICIEDTGIGIPKNKHEVIFQSFEQADGATAREFGGAGLGLSITRQLVELHGGQIWLESEPGKGSAFFFSLPVSDNPTQLISETSQVQVIPSVGLSDLKLSLPVPQTAGDRVRILVVDDEPINHQVLRNYLGEEQFLITSVMSGQEAIESIELGVKFDLVLLDVMMPQISGYQVCQKIREKHLPSELPIIMVTAKNQIQDLVEGLGVGANDYLAKPFSRDEFLARVKTQLDLHLINEVTGKFVPTAFLRALGRERITEVSLGDFTQKVTTILFADIRDYTSLSESMTPEENFRFVSAFNGRMGPIIQRHNGFINQYLGDAIMAIFQTPSDSLKSAVAMHRQLAEYNQTRRSKDRRVIHNGIGIHTGPLIMGITGDKERMDAATIADTVNTASRIENITKHYGANILLSEDSLNDITDRADFHFRYLGKVQVKGKSKAVGIYECFSGDAPQIIEKKLQTLSEFEKGVQDFFAKEFSRALDHFNHVLIANPEDQSAKHLLNRTAQCIQHGVPPDWRGVEIMELK